LAILEKEVLFHYNYQLDYYWLQQTVSIFKIVAAVLELRVKTYRLHPSQYSNQSADYGFPKDSLYF